jgi:hypothetical protein
MKASILTSTPATVTSDHASVDVDARLRKDYQSIVSDKTLRSIITETQRAGDILCTRHVLITSLVVLVLSFGLTFAANYASGAWKEKVPFAFLDVQWRTAVTVAIATYANAL